MSGKYIDLHCHPALKGFGKSFKYEPVGRNNADPTKRQSIWRNRPPNFMERWLNRTVSLTKFTQTDLSTLARSGVDVVVISLYPFEKHFLTKRILGWKGLTDLLVNLVTSISQKRIDFVRNHRDYYADLLLELDYYRQLEGELVSVDGQSYTYQIVNSYQEIETNRARSVSGPKIINLVLSIEGAHVLNTGLEMNTNTADPQEVIANLKRLQNWPIRPLFITFAHHFYNELCGHAPSISIGLIKDNQRHGLESSFTPLGWQVLKGLLTGDKPIPIDIKHMSVASRAAYFGWLDEHDPDCTIPVIASHGAVNGLVSDQEKISAYPVRDGSFNTGSINFYDDELIRICKSGGLLGIQLDARRIGSRKSIRRSKRIWVNRKKQLRRKALLVWRQIEHMAEVLDNAGLPAWDIQAIGSDFDGIVDPINGLWTALEMDALAESLKYHARVYLEANQQELQQHNILSPEKIVDKVMHGNAEAFLKKHL